MNFRNIAELVNTGKPVDVEFKEKIEDLESYPEKGMRATVTGAVIDHEEYDGDAVIRLFVDYSKFDAENASLEAHNYYDKNGEPTLTAREAGWYKIKDTLYVMANDDAEAYLTILAKQTTELFEEYKASNSTLSYVAWLESKVLFFQQMVEYGHREA